ncbi:MAG: hypothetical protein JWO10_1472 [Microbacteriaceae bacterium]|nr:hypothetical protein [Microbacteriaceae bacterium]
MKRILLTAAIAVSVIGLAGCSASGASSPASGPGTSQVAPGDVISGQVVPGAVTPGNGTSRESLAAGTDAAKAADNRQVVSTGMVTVTVQDPMASSKKASAIVEAAGGRVDSRTEDAPLDARGHGSATLTVRIPAAVLTKTLDDLGKLGSVRQVSITEQDVTASAQDLDARIGALRTSTARLTDLLSRATSTADLITIESALSDRQANLESLEAQKRGLDDQVALSTITLSLVSKADAPAHVPATFVDGLIAGWNTFVAFLAGFVVVIGVLLPWLLFLGLVSMVVILLVRRARRKAGQSRIASEDPTS